jgi:sugar lactone lactonase YvrE
MSSRGLLVKLGRYSLRSTTAIALVSALLVMAGAVGLQRVVASRSASMPKAVVATSARNLSADVLMKGPASGQKILGVFEGKYDAKTQKVSLLQPISGELKSTFKAFGRADANTLLPEGSVTRAFIRSCANPSGSVPCQPSAPANTISGEHRITNTGSLKFYNTRLIFTDFLNARGGTPVTENVFFNDGQVPANGKLGVSRDYGDIDPGTSQTRVWSFNFPSGSIQSFYFRFVIYGDVGVAAESVEPAAVQNNANQTITVNGQGFNNPTVTLLNASGATVATLASNVVSASVLTATVPAGTSAGIYSVRVTNAGGTAGGAGSSTLIGKLNVTGVPDAGHTGTPTSLSDTGPYRITGNTTISGMVLPGTVVYVDNGVTLQIGSGGLNANGGIPGVPTTSPAQIVFTRSPGATSWGGIVATSAATSEVSLKNVVVEFGGVNGSAQVDISGSGRTLRFTDSVSRRSAGAGLKATGNNDLFTGFTRSRVENNAGVGVLLSANAALGVGSTGAGMGDLDASNANTRIPDQSYYYSLANVVRNNGTDAVQIDSNANDFTRSGVLVGQGDVPLQIRGSNSNPSVVGNSSGTPGAELSINPNAIIQLDAGMDLKAGDDTLFGSIGANGYAGYSQSPSGDTSISQRIIFDKLPGGGNFGALVFTSTSGGSSILNFVSVRNGGTSPSGNAQVIIEAITYPFNFTNSESNNSSSHGLRFRSNTTVTRTGTNYIGNASGDETIVSADATIMTLAGGLFGDGNLASQAPLIQPIGIAVDPTRGVYIADKESTGGVTLRFANMTNATLKIAGIDVPAKTIKKITSGVILGVEAPNNVPMDEIDLLEVESIALSPDRNILYFVSTGSGFRLVRGINVTPGAATNTNSIAIGAGSALVGRAGTVHDDTSVGTMGDDLKGLAVNPVSGDLYIADANKSKVFRITPGGTLSTFAGSGPPPRGSTWQAFIANQDATNALIAAPEAIRVSDDGNTVYISDSSYARVIRVQAGKAHLVTQLGMFDPGTGQLDPTTNPMPSGLALYGGKLYITNMGTHTIVSIDNPSTVSAQAAPSGGATTINVPPVSLVAGTAGTTCNFTTNSCGDGGVISGLAFDFRNMSSNLMNDSNGLFVADQLANFRGRIRYLNLSGGAVTQGAVTVNAGTGNTVIGSGLPFPYNGGLATSATLASPVGTALDGNGNLFIADNIATIGGLLRFVNRGATAVTILGQTVAPGTIIGINKDAANPDTEESTNPSNAYFYRLQGLKYTSEGLYIVDSDGKSVPPGPSALHTSKLRFLNLSGSPVSFYGGAITVAPGEIKTIAGGSTDPGNIGDGLIATSAKLVGTTDVEVDPVTKDIYLSESFNKRVRKILRSTGIINSLTSLGSNQYTGLAFDNERRLLVASYNTNQVLRETAAGSGNFAPVVSSIAINKPRDIAVDASNNLYVMNSGTQQIIKIPLGGGAASVFVGTGTAGFSGDGGVPANAMIDIAAANIDLDVSPSTQSLLIQTVNITVGASGEVIFADNVNGRVRRVQ